MGQDPLLGVARKCFGPPERGPWIFCRYLPLRIPGIGPLQHIRDLVIDGKIYWPRATQFSDLLDCDPEIRTLLDHELDWYFSQKLNLLLHKTVEWRRNATSVLRSRLMSKAWLHRLAENKRRRCMVLSLTDRFDCLFHWWNYAERGEGLCVMLDVAVAVSAGNQNWIPSPVAYTDVPAPLCPIDGTLKPEPTERELETFFRAQFLTKRTRYREEAEQRLLRWAPDLGETQLIRIPTGILRGIVLGPTMMATERRLIAEWCSQASLPCHVSRWTGALSLAS